MESVGFESGSLQGPAGLLLPVVCRSFCGRDIADGFEQATMEKTIDPFEGGRSTDLQVGQRLRWIASNLSRPLIVSARAMVVAVPLAADGGFDADLGQAFGVAPA